MPDANDLLEHACALVGRFQYHFARVEQKVDQAVIKLFDLNETTAQIVTGSVDFARKVNFVRTYAHRLASADDKRVIESTCSEVFAINNVRQDVIHSSFEAASGGVQLKRTVAKDGRVRLNDELWDDKVFSGHYEEMKLLETKLDKIIALLKPVPMGWLPTWQETYHRPTSTIAQRATAGVELTQVFPPLLQSSDNNPDG